MKSLSFCVLCTKRCTVSSAGKIWHGASTRDFIGPLTSAGMTLGKRPSQSKAPSHLRKTGAFVKDTKTVAGERVITIRLYMRNVAQGSDCADRAESADSISFRRRSRFQQLKLKNTPDQYLQKKDASHAESLRQWLGSRYPSIEVIFGS